MRSPSHRSEAVKKTTRYVKAAETLEEVIRMATRVQGRLRKEGIELRWTMSFGPIEAPKQPQPGEEHGSQ
jgi:hypothetical protein